MPAEDVEHAIGNAAYRSTPYGEEPPYKIFCLGPDRAGNLLEVVLIELDGDDDLVIHAMKMRDKTVPSSVGDPVTDQSYGTSGGIEVTDAVAERLADEAEQGFDLQLLERHRVGRPRLGKERTVVFQVRLEPAMRDALKRQAKASGTTPSELARRAIQVFLSSAASGVGAGKAGRDQRRTARVPRSANVGGAMSAGAGSRSKPAIEVEPRSGGQWARQKQGTSRAASVHSTKAAAEAAARAQAKRERTELVVKGKDGRVERRNSYGDDPRRSRR